MTKAEELGYTAFNAYYDNMQSKFNLRLRRGEFWTNRFYKRFVEIGRMCLESDMDVSEYMDQAIGFIGKERVYITPKDFLRPKVIAAYRERHRQKGDMCVQDWLSNMELMTQIECDTIPRIHSCREEILDEPQLLFPAWFRVAYAGKVDERLFAHYGQAAWIEMNRHRKLRALVSKQAPEVAVELQKRWGPFEDSVPLGASHG